MGTRDHVPSTIFLVMHEREWYFNWFINPQRACTARVTVVVLSFCLSVCLSVTTFSAATRNKTANERYERVQCHTGFILKIAFFVKMLRLKVMA